MKDGKIQPGYRIAESTHQIVKDYAKELTDKLGFPVSANRAADLLIKRGSESIEQEDQQG